MNSLAEAGLNNAYFNEGNNWHCNCRWRRADCMMATPANNICWGLKKKNEIKTEGGEHKH